MKWTRRRTTKVVGGVLLVVVVLYAIFLNSVRPQMDIMHCMGTMKGLFIAFHSYHDKYGSFPPAYTVDTDGSVHAKTLSQRRNGDIPLVTVILMDGNLTLFFAVFRLK